MEKRLKKIISKNGFLLLISVLVIVGFVVFVIAEIVIHPFEPLTGLNEDVGHLFNISVNISGVGGENITQVNVTLPAGFVFLDESNGTSLNVNASFTNTSTVLSWTNASSWLMNGSTTNGTRFWFNATAVNPGNYNFTITFLNSTDGTNNITHANLSVTINDTTSPDVYASNISAPLSGGNYSGTMSLAVSLADNLALESVYFNITNATVSITQNITSASNTSTSAWSATFDTTTLGDGFYNITVVANDSNDNSNNSAFVYLVRIDNTVPGASATCSPTTITTGSTFPCSCSGSDGGSGVRTTTASSTSGSITSTGSTGTFTYSCSITDYAGKSASATVTYSVEQLSGGGTTNGGGTVTIPSKTHSWSKITPGVVSIMKNFDSEVGLKEIEITVNNEAQSVKITVTKHDSKPAAVSVAKTGKVYKYLQIDAQNLGDKLSKAKITSQVTKTWVSTNGLDKNDLALFKFNNVSSKWVELATTLTEEDDTYYYYEAETDSFSYFAIAEKISEVPIVEDDDEGVFDRIGDTLKEKNLTWLWIAIGIIVLAAVVVGMILIKKKKQ